MRSCLQYINEMTADDFDVSEKVYQEMMEVMDNMTNVAITAFECEGLFGYFNVTLPSGEVVPGLCGYHLTTIEALKNMYESNIRTAMGVD